MFFLGKKKKKKRKSIFSQMRKEAPGSQGEEAQPHVSSNGNQEVFWLYSWAPGQGLIWHFLWVIYFALLFKASFIFKPFD